MKLEELRGLREVDWAPPGAAKARRSGVAAQELLDMQLRLVKVFSLAESLLMLEDLTRSSAAVELFALTPEAEGNWILDDDRDSHRGETAAEAIRAAHAQWKGTK